MRLTCILFFLALLSVSASSFSQNTRMDISIKKNNLLELFIVVEAQSDYSFIYKKKDINLTNEVSVDMQNATVDEILKEIFKNSDLDYKIVEHYIVVKKGGADSEFANSVQGERKITGTVSDDNGELLPGVAVIVKGTTIGTSTDFDGNFSIEASSEDVLVFSFVGMRTQELAVEGNTLLNVVLVGDAIGIEEVVAVGYGTQLKTKVTGAISQVTAENLDIESRPVTSVQTALIGALSGLRSLHSNGKPGSTPGFSIRGASTTNSTNVLVIIDGFESSMSDLDPNNIESVSLLKDASAVSVYGARGANGVLLVTTKGTKKAKRLSVNYQYNHSIQTPHELPKTVNSFEYMKIKNEAQINDGIAPENVAYDQELLDLAASGFYPETIWPEEMYRSNAGQQSHNFSINGGTKNTGYLINASYLKQNGLVIGSDNFKRVNLRLRVDTEINEWLTVGTNTLLTNRVTNSTPSDGGSDLRGLPFFPVQTDEGEWVYKGGGGGVNSIASAASETFTKNQRDAMNVQLYAKLTPVKGLTIEERVSYYNRNVNIRNWNNVFDYVVLDETDPDFKQFIPGDGAKRKLSLEAQKAYTLETLTTINYNLNFDKHHGHVLLGFQSREGESESFRTGRKGFSLDNLQDMELGELVDDGIGGGIGNVSSRGGNARTVSYFGRFNYDYDSRYIAEVSFRVDGSSNFSTENQWGFFPAMSLGWNIAQESFFENVDFVDRLKLRASYGITGDDSGVGRKVIQLVNYDVTGYPIGGSIQPRLSLASPANKDLKWETATIFNAGLDFSLWGGKLQVQSEYFINNREDILDFLQTPKEFGLGNVPGNVYNVKSWGWELEINHQNRIGDLGYWMSFNISDYDNEVKDLFGRGPIVGGSSYRDVGLPLNNRYGYVTDGFFDSQDEISTNYGSDGVTPIDQNAVGKSFVGGFKFVDQPTVDSDGDGLADVGDGVINSEDRVILDENSNANFYTGFSLGVDYKGFSLSARFYGVLDRKEWWTSINATQLFPNELAPFELQTDYWREDNPDALFPLAEVNVASYPKNNSHFLHKNAFIKLKSITLSYQFSRSLLNNFAFIKGLELMASVENVGTVWTNSPAHDTGWDPELGVGSVDYPLPITTSFGAKIKF